MHIANYTLELSLGNCPEAASLPHLDAWLARHLGLAIPPYPGTIPFTGNETDIPLAVTACSVAWRTLILAAALQRAAHLPVFEPGRLVSSRLTQTGKARWHFTCVVVHLNYLPIALLHSCYKHAAAVIQKAADLPSDPQGLAQIFEQLNADLITPMVKAMPLGKSTEHILRAAHQRALPWHHIGNGVFQLGWGRQSVKFRHSSLWNDSSIGTDTAQHKYWSAQWLAQAGIPTPTQQLADTVEQALAAWNTLGNPVVIKPVDRDRGEGVSTNIHTENDVRTAFHEARKLSKQVVIERKIAGTCHRVLIVRNTLIYVVKRHPIAICGNGSSSIRELIEEKNRQSQVLAPWLRDPLLPLDDITQSLLQRQGLSQESIIPTDHWVPLRDVESTQWGGIDEDFSDTIHPENINLALRAAAVFGLDSAGIDIISTDIREPWFSNGAVVNEVNSAPSMGGGPVSIRTMPKVVEQLIPEAGRIPIHIVLGDHSRAHTIAQRYQHTYAEQGKSCLLVSKNDIVMPDGSRIGVKADGPYDRARVALFHPLADAITIVADANEPIPEILAFDQITSLDHTDPTLEKVDNTVSGPDLAGLSALERLARLIV